MGKAYKNLNIRSNWKIYLIFIFEKSTDNDNSWFLPSVFLDGTGFGNLEMLLRGTGRLP
jgi:hypothetical protein